MNKKHEVALEKAKIKAQRLMKPSPQAYEEILKEEEEIYARLNVSQNFCSLAKLFG